MRLALPVLALALLVSGCDSSNPLPETCENTSLDVEVEDLTVGTSPARVAAADVVRINYVGALVDGTEFDSGRGVPFDLRQSISGFREGLTGMRIGGTRRITIPPRRGYGGRAQTRFVDGENVEIIPACSVLVFEVDLLDILT